jgi:hypothetical protein
MTAALFLVCPLQHPLPPPCPPHAAPRPPAYPADAAADKRLADTVPDGGGFEQREALCAAVRLRERAILSRTEFVAAQQAKALRRAGAR